MSRALSKAGHTWQLSVGYLCPFSRGKGERLWRTSHREKQAFEQPTGRACSSPSLLVLEEKQTSAFEQLSGGVGGFSFLGKRPLFILSGHTLTLIAAKPTIWGSKSHRFLAHLSVRTPQENQNPLFPVRQVKLLVKKQEGRRVGRR